MVGILIADGSSPYISPGIQIGLTSKVNFFMSAQITFGYLSYSGPPPFGVTLGLRVYKIQENWKRYRYADLQIWPFLGGIGIGKMLDKDGNNIQDLKLVLGLMDMRHMIIVKILKLQNIILDLLVHSPF